MNKPTKQTKEYYDYIELSNYLKEKHSIGDDFWDWVMTGWYGTHNGSYHYLSIDEQLEDSDIPDEKKKALEIIREEFGESELEIFLWW